MGGYTYVVLTSGVRHMFMSCDIDYVQYWLAQSGCQFLPFSDVAVVTAMY